MKYYYSVPKPSSSLTNQLAYNGLHFEKRGLLEEIWVGESRDIEPDLLPQITPLPTLRDTIDFEGKKYPVSKYDIIEDSPWDIKYYCKIGDSEIIFFESQLSSAGKITPLSMDMKAFFNIPSTLSDEEKRGLEEKGLNHLKDGNFNHELWWAELKNKDNFGMRFEPFILPLSLGMEKEFAGEVYSVKDYYFTQMGRHWTIRYYCENKMNDHPTILYDLQMQ